MKPGPETSTAPRRQPSYSLALELMRAESAVAAFSAGQVDSVMDEDGSVYLLRGAQDRLLRSAARFEGIFASIPDIITILNEAGEMVYHSAALTSVLGYPPNSLLGRDVFSLVHPDDRQALGRAIAEVARQQSGSDVATVRYLTEDGAWRHLEATIGRRQPADGAGVVLALRDATQHQREHEACEKTAAEAAAQALRTDQFLSMIAHELRTPLTPVLIGLQILREEERFAEIRPTLEMMERNLRMQVRLLDELMEFIRLGHQKVHFRPESLNAHGLVRLVLEVCAHEIATANLQIHVDLGATETTVMADPLKLQQVMWNVLNNAIRFSPPGSSISIRSCNPTAESIRFEFSDQGAGIEAEFLPYVFAPFHQAVASARKRQGGLGLGMYIAKGFTEAQEGSLTVSSEGQGCGTTFHLTLPVHRGVVPTRDPIPGK